MAGDTRVCWTELRCGPDLTELGMTTLNTAPAVGIA
jgi:hypothetical protein